MRRARTHALIASLVAALAGCPGAPGVEPAGRMESVNVAPPAERDAPFDPGVPEGAPTEVRVRVGALADVLRGVLRGEPGRSPPVRALEALLGVSSGSLAGGTWAADLGLDTEREAFAAVLTPRGGGENGVVFGTRIVLPASGVDAAERPLHAALRDRGFVPEPRAGGLDALYRYDGAASAPAVASLAHVGRLVVFDVFASPARPDDPGAPRQAALARARAALADLHVPRHTPGGGSVPAPDSAAPAIVARWDFTALASLNALVLRERARRLASEGEPGAGALAEQAARAGEARARAFSAAELSLRATPGGGAVLALVAHGTGPVAPAETPTALAPAEPGAFLGDAAAAWLRAWPAAPAGESPELGARDLPGLALPFADALGTLLALPGAAGELARQDVLAQGPAGAAMLANATAFERVGVLHPGALRAAGAFGGDARPAVLVGLLPAGASARTTRCALASVTTPCPRVALVTDGSARSLPGGSFARAVAWGSRVGVLASASMAALRDPPVRVVATVASAMHGQVALPGAWSGLGDVELRGEARGADWAVTVVFGAPGRAAGLAEVWPGAAAGSMVSVRHEGRSAGGSP